MSLPLADKVTLVTGASRGIGLAIAERFVRAGAAIAICSRAKTAAGRAELDDATRALHAAMPAARPVVTVACDVADAAAVARLAAIVDETLGVPDIVVNNAGRVIRARLDETGDHDWHEVLGANLTGTFQVTRAFLAKMRARRSGRIINIASISGRQGTSRLTAYCAAKHGVVGLTRALAEETRDAGLQVNAVCPGSVDTAMLVGSGFAPAMLPDDVANLVFYLAAEAPAALTGACLDLFG